MLPLIPALILLLLSPATAERLAREGRFPAPLTVVALRGAASQAVRADKFVVRGSWFVVPRGSAKRPERRTWTVPVYEPRTTNHEPPKPSRDRDGPQTF